MNFCGCVLKNEDCLEDRGQRTEDRGQRTEDRGQRTEDIGQNNSQEEIQKKNRAFPKVTFGRTDNRKRKTENPK